MVSRTYIHALHHYYRDWTANIDNTAETYVNAIEDSFFPGRRQRVVLRINNIEKCKKLYFSMFSSRTNSTILLHVNDLPDSAKVTVRMFADNTKLYTKISLTEKLSKTI